MSADATMREMTIGVLALQGDFDAHCQMLRTCGADVAAVRDAESLAQCDAIVIPGGESTVMSRLCARFGLWEPLRQRLHGGMPAFGTCAGLILLARNLTGVTRNFQQEPLGVMDLDVARNAYGAQVNSFEADVMVPALGQEPMHGVFIRAPQVVRCGSEVEVLATHQNRPVVLRQRSLMATSFHPEISGDARLHALWLSTIRERS